MRPILVSIIALACACAPLAAQDVRVVAQDAAGITVEITPHYTMRTVVRDGTSYRDASFRGAAFDESCLPGEPSLRVFRAAVALPSLTGSTVTVLQADYQDEQNVVLLPMEDERAAENGTPQVPGAGYRTQGFRPAQLAVLGRTGIARDLITGTLQINPVQWNAAARVLRTCSRIVVRVDFGARDPRLVARTRGAQVSDNGILNSATAAAWMLARETAPRKRAEASAAGPWYRIDITQEGMYKIPKSWFTTAGIDAGSIDPRTIRIYNSGGRELPQDVSTVQPGFLHEVAIEVAGQEDGRFDDGDYVLFYGRGPAGFAYDASLRRFTHWKHRYATANSYILTFGGGAGKRIPATASLNDPAPFRPAWFTGLEYAEDDETNLLSSGKVWLSHAITAGMPTGITYTRKLESIVATEPVRYYFELWGQADINNASYFTVRENGQTLGTVPMRSVDLGTDRDDIASSSGIVSYTYRSTLPDGRSVMSFTYSAADPTRTRGGYVRWAEWNYARRFVAGGDALAFNAPDTTATVGYELNGFSMSDIHVFDVTAFDNVRRITGADISGGTVRFQALSQSTAPPQYIAVASPAFKSAPAPVRIDATDLAGAQGAAHIIITAPEFVDAANSLKAHRERAADAITSMVVTVPQIYNEFNSGTPDPTAIRDFLAYAYANWQVPPRYVLLLGTGHFDPLNVTSKQPQFVPAWEVENSVNLIDSYVTDDFYAMVSGDDRLVDLAIGRLPADNPDEAKEMVSKIISYEANPDFNPWRNRITFVADDGLTSSGDEGAQHTSQSEDIASSLTADLEQRKIYSISYRTENTPQGRRKPDAYQAIIDQINAGTLLMNYTGHGSESVWTHEVILSKETTIPKLVNADRLTFFIAATCTFGLNDRPEIRSGMQELMTKEGGGAIGGLTSPRVVFSGQNSNFNREFVDDLINKGREADGTVRRMGDGFLAAKLVYNNSSGYEKFYITGDPGMRLGLPRHHADIESISINGTPVTTDTADFKALSKITVSASVRRADGTVWSDFNGTSDVSLFDAQRSVPITEWNNWAYGMPGGLLYHGQATITNGRFTVSFIVPKDISYENRTGRFAVYFDNNATDGAGYSTAFRVGGTDASGSSDGKGPDISLYMDTRSFHAGDLTGENPLFIADLYDESGINTSGLGIGHNIEAWIDGGDPGVVLNEYYKGETDSYQRGIVEYPLHNLTEGTHTIRLRAWDINNNSSTAETYFTVSPTEHLTIRNVYAIPNPAVDHASFTFQHNQSGAVDVEVKIYTISGRLVATLDQRNVTDRFVNVPWSGKDGDGDRLANGVYFFKVVCRTADGSKGSEALGKLSVLR